MWFLTTSIARTSKLLYFVICLDCKNHNDNDNNNVLGCLVFLILIHAKHFHSRYEIHKISLLMFKKTISNSCTLTTCYTHYQQKNATICGLCISTVLCGFSNVNELPFVISSSSDSSFSWLNTVGDPSASLSVSCTAVYFCKYKVGEYTVPKHVSVTACY